MAIVKLELDRERALQEVVRVENYLKRTPPNIAEALRELEEARGLERLLKNAPLIGEPPPAEEPPVEPPAPTEKPFRVYSSVSQWQEKLGNPAARTEVEFGGRKAIKMTVLDTDGANFGPTSDPRSQLGTENLIAKDQTFYWSGSFYVPSLTLPSGGWLNIVEFFGYPYRQSPPFQLQLFEYGGKTLFGFRHNQTYNYAPAWTAPPAQYTDRWVKYVVGLKHSVDGWADVWLSSASGVLTNVVPTLGYKVWDGSGDLPARPIIQHYRKRGMFSTATLYHDVVVRLGNTFDSVK